MWGEMDNMGHVNNVAYVRYAESARVGWVRGVGMREGLREGGRGIEKWEELWSSRGTGMILRDIRVAYKFVSWSFWHGSMIRGREESCEIGRETS